MTATYLAYKILLIFVEIQVGSVKITDPNLTYIKKEFHGIGPYVASVWRTVNWDFYEQSERRAIWVGL